MPNNYSRLFLFMIIFSTIFIEYIKASFTKKIPIHAIRTGARTTAQQTKSISTMPIFKVPKAPPKPYAQTGSIRNLSQNFRPIGFRLGKPILTTTLAASAYSLYPDEEAKAKKRL